MTTPPAPHVPGQAEESPIGRASADRSPLPDRPSVLEPAWLDWPLGAKVVVRRRLAEGGYSDRVGELIEKSAAEVVVRTRRFGDVRIGADEIAIGKVVPPPMARRPRAPQT